MARALVLIASLSLVACNNPKSGTGGGSGGSAGGGTSSTGGGTAAGGGSAATGGGSSTGGGSAAGGGTGGGTFSGDGGSYTCDIEGIVESRCLDCHSNPPRFGAPMSLETYADTQVESTQYPGQKIYQRMAFRVADDMAPMPQQPNPRLTTDQIAAMQNWAASGAAPGDPSCAPDGGAAPYDGGTAACPAGSTAIDFTAPMFAIPQATDFYQCFAFNVTLPMNEDLIQLDKIVDNAQVLHHMVVFRDPLKNSMNQGNCGFKASWQVLYAWAPGTGPFVPPPDIGIPVANGDQIIIQLHYNNPTMISGNDSSGVRMCATPTMRQKQAGVLAIGPTSFTLPPQCSRASVSGDCGNVLNTSYEVFTDWPHMHKLGIAQQTTLHQGGVDTVVESRPNYTFGAQYLESTMFNFNHGDSLTIQCSWDTTGQSGPVKWGESTGDEMCFNFLYVTPPPPIALCPATNVTSATCTP